MIRFLLITILTLAADLIFGQRPLERKYPKTLMASNDSFAVRFSNFPSYAPSFRVSENDTTDMGTDGGVGLYAMIYFGHDSTRINYQNLPFDEVYFINIHSPKGNTVYRLHFNNVRAAYDRPFIDRNRGKVQVEVPEVYELANIIWALSPSGQRAENLNKQGEYYNKVVSYFKRYLNHPVFRKLDFKGDDYNNYYDFRENSFAFSFNNNNKLVWGRPYFYVSGSDRNFNSLFKQLSPLIEDFASQSNYRAFYKSNLAYYQRLKERELELMPVKNMWQWLENQFPDKFESYKVVFSPLISASHSTQNFSSFVDGDWFRETVVFVSGPTIFDADKQLNEKQNEGLASGIVFTEIDHNYINPVSSKFKRAIDSIFSKREVWTSAGGDTKFYESPESVFNEYMTHAVFCLYVLDNYDSALADFIIKKREALMVEHRHYIKFREFDRRLIELRNQHKGEKVSDLFPQIIDWCKSQT
jgi:hypothetical protein